MSNYNMNSGYGQVMANRLAQRASGKPYVVGVTGVAHRDIYSDVFAPDPSGKTHFFNSIAQLVTMVTLNSGDTVYVLPGHTETITAAAGIALSVAGISVVGLGNGRLRPTITFTTAVGASFDITAANVSIDNIVFVNAIDAQTAMVNVNATDSQFTNCEFVTNSATTGAVLGIYFGSTAAADRFNVQNCRFIGPAVNTGTTVTAQIQYEQAVDFQIVNSYFTGKETQAILNVTAGVLRGLIDNNRFVIATGTHAISLNAASTPLISNNRMNVPSGTAPIVAAAAFVSGNSYSAAAGVTAGTASTF